MAAFRRRVPGKERGVVGYLQTTSRGLTRFKFADPIPTAVVAPLLQQAVDGYQAFKMNANQTGRAGAEYTSGFSYIGELVAIECGGKYTTWERKLRRILAQETEYCSITDVDRYLVVLGCHHWWYEPPLVEWYFDPAVIGEAA